MKRDQIQFFQHQPKAYGGELLKKRKGRRGPRPLDTKNSMHLVLRSSQAKGRWSFRATANAKKVEKILKKFSSKYGVRVFSVANVGNHLHLHIQLGNRYAYKPFIRAITAAIAMAVTGASRWKKLNIRFWDLRPFTRVVLGRSAWQHLVRYIRLNQLEGMGYSRDLARVVMFGPQIRSLNVRWNSS